MQRWRGRSRPQVEGLRGTGSTLHALPLQHAINAQLIDKGGTFVEFTSQKRDPVAGDHITGDERNAFLGRLRQMGTWIGLDEFQVLARCLRVSFNIMFTVDGAHSWTSMEVTDDGANADCNPTLVSLYGRKFERDKDARGVPIPNSQCAAMKLMCLIRDALALKKGETVTKLSITETEWTSQTQQLIGGKSSTQKYRIGDLAPNLARVESCDHCKRYLSRYVCDQ
jgi:hypothetical protein